MSNENKNIEAIYELSPMQQGMLFHTILNENSRNYFEQISVTISGNLNIEAFRLSWEKIIKRHSILRTSFVYKKIDKMLQIVHKDFSLPFNILDFTTFSPEEKIKEINNFLIQDKINVFNLNKPLLLRLSLIKLEENKYKFIWSHHHLLLDGWSIPIILKELFSFYGSIIHDKELKLEIPIPYKNYIKYLQSKNDKVDIAFWKNYLSGFNEKTPLNLDHFEQVESIDDYIKKSIKLSSKISKELNSIARFNKITISSILQAGWALLLNKYSRNSDIVFGVTFSGRPYDIKSADSMVGLFINTLPVRAIINPNEKILDWILQFSYSTNKLRDYEHTALYEVQKHSEIPPKENLFDSLFVFENYPVDDSFKISQLGISFEDFSSFEETNYPLTIISAPGECISIDAAYKSCEIDDFKIDLLLEHFKNLLEFIAFNPTKKINEIQYLTKEEKEFLLPIKFEEPDLSEPLIVIRQFEEIVKKYPNNIALRSQNREMTYYELNKKANRFANYLRDRGIGLEDFISVYVNRNFEMIISMLAVLKTGACYVPIDPNYPAERVDHIISDSNSKFLITEISLSSKINFSDKRVIFIDRLDEITKDNSGNNLNIEIFPENLIYVIYTSGSTGKPKGTLLQNKSVYNFINDFSESIDINNKSRVLQFASIGFDASVPEIYSPLLNGGSVQLTSYELLEDLSSLSEFVINNEVTTLLLPPAVLSTIPVIESQYLKTILSAGEVCSWEIVEKWSKFYRFINGYGPTEASVGCTWGTYKNKLNTNTVPIGIPIFNVKVYVLDNYLQPVPFGVPGELFVGENALARGYLNKPALTANKFIPNPYSKIPGERIYRTNDLVKVLPDGQLEFLGRIDNQVKLRGFRIELEEIETTLKSNSLIKDAAVVLHENDGKKLVAFIASKNNDEIKIDDIKKFISSRLPSYMIPSHFEIVESFPLTAHKKIDRKKLQNYNLNNSSETNLIEDSLNATEELLINIVKNILLSNRVKINENFFELGGHSLSATQFASRIREAFQIELPINIIFEKGTLKELAKEIDLIKTCTSKLKYESIIKLDKKNDVPLSFAQQRMWFIQKFDLENVSNNIFNSFILSGNLKIDVLTNSINFIIERHEIFRTIYYEKDGKPFQKIVDQYEITLPIFDYSNISEEDQIRELESLKLKLSKKVFRLTELPLFDIHLVKLSQTKYVLMFVVHHIIADGWSINIFIKELTHFYNAQLNKANTILPAINIQYSDFAQWQNNQLKDENLRDHLKYWINNLKDIPEKIDLPIDKSRPSVKTFNGDQLDFNLDELTTRSFNEMTRKFNLTPFMLSLAAFKVLLHKYSNQNTIVIGSPIANRKIKETENLIGFFVNTLVIKTDFSEDDKIIDVIKKVRESTLQSYLYQDLPFEKLVDNLKPNRDMSISPIFQVAFVFQNTIPEKLELPELNIEFENYHNNIAKYDLTLYMQIRNEKLFGTFEYNTDLFEKSTIKRMVEHFKNIINQIIENPKNKIAKINLLSREELYEYVISNTILYNTSKKYFSIVDKFYDVISKNPNKIAINFSYIEGQTIFTDQYSYEELNIKSNQLARYLLDLGLKRENIVGISMDRSFDMIVAIFAVLKAGGVFLPIDPSYPDNRIKYMCKDSQLNFVITNEIYNSIFENSVPTILLFENIKEIFPRYDVSNIFLEIDPLNLAYVIYTSGSTGKPKGTFLLHGGLINLTEEQRKAFNLNINSNILQFASSSFDASVWEIFMAILNGALLTITNKEIISSPEDLSKIIQNNKVTNITLPPTVLKNLIISKENLFNDLETIILAGEKCPQSLVKEWGTNRQFVNAYGPTETTVCASIYNCNVKEDKDPPIGKAIGNFVLLVLDKNMNPLPIGIPGELYIGGIGIARGYLNKPDMTAEKFVPNPFSNIKGERLYKSGDLVKLLEDGNIEFIGRIDSQIKLRGFRIELSEIENQLNQHKFVKNSVVRIFSDENSNEKLVAYIELMPNSVVSNIDFKIYLSMFLPNYMVPTHFIFVENFSLTNSGKIDLNKLPIPVSDTSIIKAEYTAPRNEVEKKMCEIVEELLGVDKVGINDNFFDLGGHSLLATQFVSRIKEKLGFEVTLKRIFEKPTIADLLESIKFDENHSPNDEIFTQTRGDNNLESLLGEIISAKKN